MQPLTLRSEIESHASQNQKWHAFQRAIQNVVYQIESVFLFGARDLFDTFDGQSARANSAFNRSFSDETSCPHGVVHDLFGGTGREACQCADHCGDKYYFCIQHTQFPFVHQALAYPSKRPPGKEAAAAATLWARIPESPFFALLTST